MGNSAKKIIGLLLMMCSVFLLLGGLYLEADSAVTGSLLGGGVILLIAGILLYRLTGDSEK